MRPYNKADPIEERNPIQTMRPSRVKERWAEGKLAFCTQVHSTDPFVCELVSSLGFDCIWIDMEHHATSVESASQMMRAARTGPADIMARPSKGEFMRMSRMLEAGAQGILYPRCDDAREAAEVVRWCKFAPEGERGVDGSNPDNTYNSQKLADYSRAANANTFIAIQIESPGAVSNARAIANVSGVDMLFFGPADYSVLTGVPGEFEHPNVIQAAEEVCRASLAAGKHFGTLCKSPGAVPKFLSMGATFLAYASDVNVLRGAYENIRQDFTKLGFGFED